MPDVLTPRNDVDLLRAIGELAHQEADQAGPELTLLLLVERLLVCESALTLADEDVRSGRPQADVAGATTVLLIRSEVDGVFRGEVELRREPARPFGDRERVLVDLLRPHVTSWLTRLGAPPGTLWSSAITERQLEILGLVRCGMSNKEIARALGLSPATVRKHLQNAFERLGTASRTAAVSAAFSRNAETEGWHV
ncbi:helix-turn-helix transcriptional regulator [Ornithinimicrobium cryptoxanthini]|uniref:LuxR C-terminal-related transcriptional regulator n=1 Tax=Ornithinimicrobium cryptoxanthini TaxID=2934161 RepID=A0ABY4YH95_9MICO|nr:LuxR C-terminal-related transcriptional regulator [Ornithinimicrobium cryptoxanthini]USQ76007.1 LuxR C-terminal-related transcriptional regulator [Ornithinimicrobium cryptoxanthini]